MSESQSSDNEETPREHKQAFQQEQPHISNRRSARSAQSQQTNRDFQTEFSQLVNNQDQAVAENQVSINIVQEDTTGKQNLSQSQELGKESVQIQKIEQKYFDPEEKKEDYSSIPTEIIKTEPEEDDKSVEKPRQVINQQEVIESKSFLVLCFFFQTTFFIVNLALVIAAIVAVSYDSKCETREGKDDISDDSNFIRGWLVSFIIVGAFYSFLSFMPVVCQSCKSTLSDRETSNNIIRNLSWFLLQIFSAFLMIWLIVSSYYLWGFDEFQCADQEVEDILYVIVVIFWIEIFLSICVSAVSACFTKRKALEELPNGDNSAIST